MEQQKTNSAKTISSSKKIGQSDNLPCTNYKTRYYLAAKKRHCSSYSLNQSKAIASGMSRGFAKCPSCLKWFCSRESLNNHQKKFNHWTKQPGCKCPICHNNFLSLARRNSHMQCHLHDEHKVEADKFLSEITCGHCKKCFNNKQQKLKHVAEKHDSPKITIPSVTITEKNCITQTKSKQSVKRLSGSSKCNTKAKSTTKLPSKKPINLKSSKQMLSKQVRCSFCLQLFSGPQNLTRHIRRKHHGVLQYQCSVCSAKFPSFLEAVAHKKMRHKSGTVKRVVKKSQKRNKSENAVKQTGKSGSSEVCASGVPLLQTDSTDTSDAVPKGNKLSCSVCNIKKFSSSSSLRRHENTLYHKKNVAMQNKTKSKGADGDSDINISCSVCKQEFSKIHSFVLHRLGHFVSDCDVSSIEADTSYCYGCEICGDEIFGIKKVQFHLLWHAYLMRCARKTSEVLIERPPCSCGKSKPSARISLTCIDCKNSFCNRNEFVKHKIKCSNIDEKECLKYCITHDTELCCSDDRKNHVDAKYGNGSITTKPVSGGDNECDEQVLIPVNSSHKEVVQLVDLTVHQLSQPRHAVAAQVFPPLTCSVCRQVARSLKEFREHTCSLLDEPPMSSNSQSTSNPSVAENDSSSEPAESLTKRLRKRPNALPDNSLHIEKSGRHDCDTKLDSFRHNLSNLVNLMINDERLIVEYGWNTKPVEVVIEELLKLIGREPCRRVNGMTDTEVFRKNVLLFLQQYLKDTVMKELAHYDSLESMVKNVLMYLTIFRPSIVVRD